MKSDETALSLSLSLSLSLPSQPLRLPWPKFYCWVNSAPQKSQISTGCAHSTNTTHHSNRADATLLWTAVSGCMGLPGFPREKRPGFPVGIVPSWNTVCLQHRRPK